MFAYVEPLEIRRRRCPKVDNHLPFLRCGQVSDGSVRAMLVRRSFVQVMLKIVDMEGHPSNYCAVLQTFEVENVKTPILNKCGGLRPRRAN